MGAITDLSEKPSGALAMKGTSTFTKKRAQALFVHSSEPGSGKALVSLGVLDMILRRNPSARVGFFRPVISKEYNSEGHPDEDTVLVLKHFKLQQTFEESFGMRTDRIKQLLGENRHDDIVEHIINKFKALEQRCDFILCEGRHGTAVEFNVTQEMAKNLGCPILILANACDRQVTEALETVQIALDQLANFDADIVGIVLNKANPCDMMPLQCELEKRYKNKGYMLEVIPYDKTLSYPRISDVAETLGSEVLYGKDFLQNKFSKSILGTMQLQNVLNWIRQDDELLVTSGDRIDILVGALQAHHSSNYPRLAGIVLTGGERPDEVIERLLDGLLESLPVLLVNEDSFSVAHKVDTIHASIRHTDLEKINLSIQAFQSHCPNRPKLVQRILGMDQPSPTRSIRRTMTPKMFSYDLVQQARSNTKHIVLPEGSDPRIIRAAAQLIRRGIARLTLLGEPDKITKSAIELGVTLPPGQVTIIDPLRNDSLLDKYAKIFFELRKHKGTVPNISAARDEVMDVTCFATMMVQCGDADGLVSGANHTTRHTISPALKVIKTKPGFNLVSSVFLMCMDHNVLVYGDCAVNPNPTAPQLAEIAMASADTAEMFGIEPKVAMLSYSSGSSGKGSEVEKVREATRIVRERRPKLQVEGPIQYDAAKDPEVAAQKMPDSVVAGQATVFVFPDLNTANNTYKAVQRETGSVCVGPILQGLRKPVNDLSRGCTVEDIVSTVVITACQAQIVENV